jgi:hypothetical protein
MFKIFSAKILFDTEKKSFLSQIESLTQEISDKNLELQTEKSFYQEKQAEMGAKVKDLELKNKFCDEEIKKISGENVRIVYYAI